MAEYDKDYYTELDDELDRIAELLVKLLKDEITEEQFEELINNED